MNSTALTIFIAITAAAFLLQALILLGFYLMLREKTTKMELAFFDFQRRLTPLIENARDILADATPKLNQATSNLAEASATLRSQAGALGDAALEMAVRARNKVVQADDILTRTLERVEKTTGAVQNSVLSPVRQVNGILHGLSVGIGAFLNHKREVRSERQRGTNDEGMFI